MKSLREYYTMPRCAVLGCRNDSRELNNTNSGISYYRFPSDVITRQRWTWASGRQYWKPPKSATICSVHFRKEDYHMHANGYRCLKDHTVPTLQVFTYDEKETISDSDEDQEPSTSTDCQTNTEDVYQEKSQLNDDDDIICVEPSPTKLNPTTAETTAEEHSAAPKRKKTKLTQSNDDIVQKLEVPYDEFQMFANNIAAQLRTLPLDVALNLQTKMHKLVAKERSERYRMSQQVDIALIVKAERDN